MTYNEIVENVYKDVILLAKTLYREHRVFSLNEVIAWINKRHPKLPSPYVTFNGVLQAAYDRAKDDEAREVIMTVFTKQDGSNAWQ